LGIRNLRVFNCALLGRWLWHYGIKRDTWWRVAVNSKYGNLWNGWCSLKPVGAFGVGLWKNIKKGWESFTGYTRFDVGDGTRTSFRHELWCGDLALKVDFPLLFGIACEKDTFVVNNLEFLGISNQWNVNFTREAHDWEVDVFASFLKVFHSVQVRKGGEEKLWWVPSIKVCSRSSPFVPWLVLTIVISPGRVCGGLKLPQGRLFVHGQQLLARSLPWIISRSSVLS
jgi:hypothetical protein